MENTKSLLAKATARLDDLQEQVRHLNLYLNLHLHLHLHQHLHLCLHLHLYLHYFPGSCQVNAGAAAVTREVPAGGLCDQQQQGGSEDESKCRGAAVEDQEQL